MMLSHHQDMHAIFASLYQALQMQDIKSLSLGEQFYIANKKALLFLRSEGYISFEEFHGLSAPLSINMNSPDFIMDLGSMFDDKEKIAELNRIVSHCKEGTTLVSGTLADQLNLPKTVVRACFEINERQGQGYCSGGYICLRYLGR
ncbi:hypothetical protein HRH59_18300 [Rheinheimera sp. YQF-2]|uniref:Uncharacterized protein n=1 Tax=Rheinheimera lutimaris TaxID=2740584 RepID=A0A7Y5AV42_9GAMM|nr:hypothetical protein [Rheinheimera lutimaris]NRQ44495.1 hypothetical protein [Rheinheimera lutimaris]